MQSDINKNIENLIYYAKDNLKLSFEDAIYAKNQLYDLFKINMPSYEFAEKVDLQTEILDPMLSYAIEKKLTTEDERLLFETKIMGFVCPSPSNIIAEYNRISNEYGSEAATRYLYGISLNNNYIRVADIKKNIRWMTTGENGDIGITINLAKPEKDNKKVLEAKYSTEKKYPQCKLCLENLGYPGNLNYPARQTLRYVPIELNGEKWHLQYSPYVYYDEHCIAFADTHSPMKIDDITFARLLDFVEQFPHYFLGSNADLPIVGGSILAHDHYQGGKKVLPMLSRPLRRVYGFESDITIGIKDWYNSVVHIKSKNKFKVQLAAEKVLTAWQGYSDKKVGIECYTNAPHNTVTPIASMTDNKEYCMDLILRNNRTDEEHPYGIYHPTEDMHNIKKEGIGLIEAMGLFILPGRLKKEINLMINILSQDKIDFAALNDDESLSKHIEMIAQIAVSKGSKLDKKDARDSVIEYINTTCKKILECTAVFKNDKEGELAFDRFLKTVKNI